MNVIVKKYNETSLILRIVIGLVIGAIVGVICPAGIAFFKLLGNLFVGALKALAPVLVFFLVMSSLANAKQAGGMKKIICLYIVSMLVAALVTVAACYVFPVSVTLSGVEAAENSAPSGVGEVLMNIVMSIVSNPVVALSKPDYIGILSWAILLGIALRVAPQPVKDVFTSISDAVSTIVRWVINLAPFGIFGLVYVAVSENGIEIFTEYGQLILVLVSCMLFIALVSNPVIVWTQIHKNPYPLVLRTLKDSAITAFFTRSSAANIPVNMELCRKLGLDKDTYSVSIPLGATINMAGATVTITVMALTAAHTLGIMIHPANVIILCVLAAISAAGASGVAGGSLLLIPLACALLGIDNDIAMQMVAIGFIIGVVQDSCETALNSSSDVLFTATADYSHRRALGIDFTPGKDAPFPEELKKQEQLTQEDIEEVEKSEDINEE